MYELAHEKIQFPIKFVIAHFDHDIKEKCTYKRVSDFGSFGFLNWHLSGYALGVSNLYTNVRLGFWKYSK